MNKTVHTSEREVLRDFKRLLDASDAVYRNVGVINQPGILTWMIQSAFILNQEALKFVAAVASQRGDSVIVGSPAEWYPPQPYRDTFRALMLRDSFWLVVCHFMTWREGYPLTAEQLRVMRVSADNSYNGVTDRPYRMIGSPRIFHINGFIDGDDEIELFIPPLY